MRQLERRLTAAIAALLLAGGGFVAADALVLSHCQTLGGSWPVDFDHELKLRVPHDGPLYVAHNGFGPSYVATRVRISGVSRVGVWVAGDSSKPQWGAVDEVARSVSDLTSSADPGDRDADRARTCASADAA